MTAFLDALAKAVSTQLIKPQTISTSATSAAIDLNDYIGQVKIVVTSTKGTDADEVLTPTLVTCQTSGGSYDLTYATMDTVLGSGGTDEVVEYTFDAKDPERYMKLVLTGTGTTPAHIASGVIIGVKRTGA